MSDKNRTWVGWQGIVAEVPADWSLAAVSGDEKSGYFRVDSTGSFMLEAKWSKAGKRVDLQGRLRTYLDDLRRRARKKRETFESNMKTKDAGAVAFSWRSDRKAHGRLWLCEKCSRVIIAQLSGSVTDDVSGAASVILPTFEDHAENGWRPWAVYDLIAEAPPGYALEKHRLMSGYIQLIFRKQSNRLIIERWGLANVVLRNTSLRDWFKDRAVYDLRPYRYSIEEMQFGGEPGIHVTGRRSGVVEYLKAGRELLAFRKPAMYLDGYIWVCEESNKILSVQSLHVRDEDVLDQVLERVECH
jgi:hypothetical protein